MSTVRAYARIAAHAVTATLTGMLSEWWGQQMSLGFWANVIAVVIAVCCMIPVLREAHRG